MNEQQQSSDREQVLAHIHGLFEAYIRADLDAIRRGHTLDWCGFQVSSTALVRGIEAYMANARRILETIQGVRYELLDVEIQVYGQVAVVYYTAHYWIRAAAGGERLLPLRSVDVYRKDGGAWNQAGSNICVLPAADGPLPQAPTPQQLPRILADRERLWRAWFADDRAVLDELLPDGSFAVNAGQEAWLDRPGILAEAERFVRRGGRLIRLEFPRTHVQMYGDVAVLYTTYELQVEEGGRAKTMRGRGTEIFVRRGETWLNPGWHLDGGS